MARIEDYALLGDLQTAALVDRAGSIDWCCFPRFDSGACFSAILGAPDNGRWRIAPAARDTSIGRGYPHHTIALEPTHSAPAGVVHVIDFMPPRNDVPDI